MHPGELPPPLRALADRYEIAEEIGRGGTAVVFRARRRTDGAMVAIKTLRAEVAVGLPTERFLREIAFESRFQHPGIVPILDSGQADGVPFFVMPLCEGESLRHRLDREGALPLDEAVRIAGEVAAALSYAHAQGVVHRDVKPENILLAGGRALVADFGVARALSEAAGDRLTESGVAVGTPSYMSPEQAGGDRRLDARSDIYSLACVVYEMLGGDPPFTGKSAQAIVARHLVEPPPSIRVVRQTLPDGVEYALGRALAKSPADRFESAEAFVAALTALPPAGWQLSPVVPAVRRRRMLALGGAVFIVALVVWWAIWPRLRPLDAKRVVIFPLSDVRTAATSTGWEVALAINSSLEHAQPLLGIDGWQYLSAAARAAPSTLTNQDQRRIARSRSARYFLSGAISRQGDSATVQVALYDVPSDSLVGSESVVAGGDAAAIAGAGMRAAARLLPRILDPGRHIDLTSLLDRKPGALALWLQGERAYRQSHFEEALALLQRALSEDSLLSVAAVRAAQAAGWQSDYALADRLIAVALAHDSLLGPASSRVAHGVRAYMHGDADSAVRFLESASVLLPEDAAPPMLLGEVYHHLMPVVSADSNANASWREAVRRDTSFTPAYIHLAERALLRGEFASAERMVDRLRAARADSTLLRQLALMAACVRDRGRLNWPTAARDNAQAVILAGHQLAVGARHGECAKGAFRAVMASDSVARGFRWHAFLGLQGLLISQGRGDEATRLLDSVVVGTPGARALYPINLVAGAPTAAHGPRLVALADSLYGPGYERSSAQTRWVLALWHASQRDVPMVERIAKSLFRQADSSGKRRDQLIARATAAHARLVAGDTAAAIAALQALRPSATRDSLVNDLFESLAVERITLARLLLARRQYAQAFDAAAAFDHPQSIMNLAFLRESLVIREQAARQLGRERVAADMRRRARALESAPL